MEQVLAKRHTLWRERLLVSWFSRFVVGLILVVLLPGLMLWGLVGFYAPDMSKLNSMLGVAVTYIGVFFTLRRLMSYPGCQSANYILPTVLVWYGLLVGVFFVFRLDYSVYYIFYTAVANMLFCFFSYFFIVRHMRKKVAFLPLGKASGLNEVEGVEWFKLSSPTLNGERVDAIAADLHAEIPDEWQRFLARCTLAGVPVYHYKQLMESLTGRVKINHLAENEFGSLQPPVLYSAFKRLLDISAVLITAPVTLPVMLLTAIAVKLDSPGPALFIQNRVGQGNRDFKIYKFRSMGKDSEAGGAQLAQSNDMRVTRVGKIIRKTRLDEFPQFFNVLKGDMSLIGPRPEQRAFVEKFDQDIPFYIYRHVVKPGITGWAQVVHGYASDADDTRVKIQHDFYYIKHFSLWLDVLIVLKTIRTIFTGFGAK
ncbi:lipopolysaccharide/colanic/teichoic acid biosynthesis glycosyltransferase [Oceanisphaera litoralis]|uniref:sugar transferase n=1 Tax=Oceanisphaera litoralis TaxID=225144 RepID=UPI001958B5CD|nr:sugar transferase [Oceanisphaera litoralis]MBM7454920.1 lipopolysaccharide/colanic/teichoic acid biosynthesis glycosyltransferase [Oceanisphaera litoralis]